MVYGHRQKGDCEDIEELVELKPLDKNELIAKIKSISPKGKTPIAASIKLAADKLKVLEEQTTIILISDGEETCDPDPCEAVKKLKDAGIDFILHVIRFDVSKEERLQLECLAKAGGGIYVPADSAEKLDEAFREVEKVVLPESVIKVQENKEIFLDRSAAMGKPFEGRTKLDAAVKAVNEVLNRPVAGSDNLAFRQFGGSCEGDNTQFLVKFGQNNVGKIREALGGVKIGGEPTLAAAVLKAIEDFNDAERFEGVSKRVIIITGSRDSCEPQAEELIRQRLQASNIQPDFYFIGMDVPPDKQVQLSRIGSATEGRMFFVQTQEELTRVLETIFEVEPVIADIEIMTEILNTVVGHLNTTAQNIDQKDYSAAESELGKALGEFKRTELPFQDLGKRQSREEFRRLYELARANREIQNQMLKLSETMIAQAKRDDVYAYNNSVIKVNELASTYNSNVNKINEILRSF